MNIQEWRRKAGRLWRFLVYDIWDIEVTSLSRGRGLGVRVVRVVQLVFKGFRDDECPLHASALTFSTLMSIIPVLALSLAVAKGLGDAETAKDQIRGAIYEWTQTFSGETNAVSAQADGETGAAAAASTVEPMPPSQLAARINALVEDGFDKIENISFAALGGVGSIVLFWIVIQVLGRVESSFNRVWGVTVGRSFWRRFTDYLSVLFILPVLIVAASSLPFMDFATRFLNESTAETVRAVLDSGPLKSVTVIVMTSLAFTFLIMFMPNTRVRIGPGLTGGFVAGIAFIVWLSICAALQVGVARYGKIYGSFAVVPIILAWVFVSWEIVLFGAETAFAVQNCATYHMEQESRNASTRSRLVLALSVMLAAVRSMARGERGFEATAFARERGVSVRLLQRVMEDLTEAGFVVPLSEEGVRYVLIKAPSALTVKDVWDGVLGIGAPPESMGLADVDPEVAGILDSIDACLREHQGGKTLETLAGNA